MDDSIQSSLREIKLLDEEVRTLFALGQGHGILSGQAETRRGELVAGLNARLYELEITPVGEPLCFRFGFPVYSDHGYSVRRNLEI